MLSFYHSITHTCTVALKAANVISAANNTELMKSAAIGQRLTGDSPMRPQLTASEPQAKTNIMRGDHQGLWAGQVPNMPHTPIIMYSTLRHSTFTGPSTTPHVASDSHQSSLKTRTFSPTMQPSCVLTTDTTISPPPPPPFRSQAQECKYHPYPHTHVPTLQFLYYNTVMYRLYLHDIF